MNDLVKSSSSPLMVTDMRMRQRGWVGIGRYWLYISLKWGGEVVLGHEDEERKLVGRM